MQRRPLLAAPAPRRRPRTPKRKGGERDFFSAPRRRNPPTDFTLRTAARSRAFEQYVGCGFSAAARAKGTAAAARAKVIHLTERDLRGIAFAAEQGMAQESIARCLGVSPEVFTRWKREDPRCLAALERGRALGEARATTVVMEHIERGNLSAAMFLLKTRYNWKEYAVVDARALAAPAEAAPESQIAAVLARLTDAELATIASIVGKAAGRAIVAPGGGNGAGPAAPTRLC